MLFRTRGVPVRAGSGNAGHEQADAIHLAGVAAVEGIHYPALEHDGDAGGEKQSLGEITGDKQDARVFPFSGFSSAAKAMDGKERMTVAINSPMRIRRIRTSFVYTETPLFLARGCTY